MNGDSAKRALVNTIAQYTRAIINIFLSFYSTRLILEALGQDDYGIYSLVAGVVAMLAYITNALVTTTQRYLSFYFGKKDFDYLKKIFTNSIFVHLCFAVLICVALLAMTNWLIYDYFIIPAGRHQAAELVYVMAVAMLFFTVMAAPFKALFISRENIVYISIIEVCDGILKLGLAIYLLHSNLDKLILYAVMMTFIQLFTFVAFAIYGKYKYEECRLLVYFKDIEKVCINQLLSFAGWTLYGTGCVVGRMQGFAIVLNRFFGIIFNAAYGIAQQVTGAILFLSLAIINAISPQIIKAEGSNNREEMLRLSEVMSKYSFLILSMIGIPLMIEMPEILRVWLKDIPDAAISFCRFIILASICDQITIGLGTAIQASGNIRNYTVVVNTIKIMTIPAMCVALYYGMDVHTTLWLYVIFEIICSIARLPFAKHIVGLSIRQFLYSVIFPIVIPTCAIIIVGWSIINFVNFPFRFIFTIPVCVIADCIFIWCFTLHVGEKDMLKGVARHFLKL